jgi:uncharacterized protein (DUF1330 family)
MTAYIVFIREQTLDQAEMDIYTEEIKATLKDTGVKILAAYGKQEALKGPDTEGIVVAEFPSFEIAKAWYDSPAYRKVREHRFKGAKYHGMLVEGV